MTKRRQIPRIERVLALDTGSACGWATVCRDGLLWTPPQFGSAHFPQLDRARRWREFHDWLADFVFEAKPDIIAYERGFHRGPGSLSLFGFHVVAEMVGDLHGVTVLAVANATIRKFSGVRHGKLMESAGLRGWRVADDHQADACFLAEYVALGLYRAVAA